MRPHADDGTLAPLTSHRPSSSLLPTPPANTYTLVRGHDYCCRPGESTVRFEKRQKIHGTLISLPSTICSFAPRVRGFALKSTRIKSHLFQTPTQNETSSARERYSTLVGEPSGKKNPVAIERALSYWVVALTSV
eukprot:GEMP01113414.1.p1 GENE.GEMP01113414.1~~GEMP01113414.1.p1  ORF type:complete len:135 (-),score=14.78 GEMP01113414.1:138-542(-)